MKRKRGSTFLSLIESVIRSSFLSLFSIQRWLVDEISRPHTYSHRRKNTKVNDTREQITTGNFYINKLFSSFTSKITFRCVFGGLFFFKIYRVVVSCSKLKFVVSWIKSINLTLFILFFTLVVI